MFVPSFPSSRDYSSFNKNEHCKNKKMALLLILQLHILARELLLCKSLVSITFIILLKGMVDKKWAYEPSAHKFCKPLAVSFVLTSFTPQGRAKGDSWYSYLQQLCEGLLKSWMFFQDNTHTGYQPIG